MRTALKTYALVAAVNVLLIALFVGAAELFLWQKGVRPYERTYPGQFYSAEHAPWARPDPYLGWTLNPDNFPDEVNPQGFRDAKDFDKLPAAASRTRVMVLGDSFVAGSRGVRPADTIPGRLQQRLRDHEVFGLAVPGWGIDQMYLAYERYKAAIDPGVVVLFFIDDDVKRVLEAYRTAERLNKPSFTVVDGALVPRGSPSRAQLAVSMVSGWSVLLSTVAREVYLGTDARAVVGQMFRTLGTEMACRDGKAIVVRIPTRDDDHLATSLRRRLYDFESFVTGTGATYLDAARVITGHPDWTDRFYIEDGHLNEEGVETVVNFLVEKVFSASSGGLPN